LGVCHGGGLEAAGVLEPGTRFWIVENAEGRIVASTGIEYGPAAVLFRSTAVDPAYRRRGLALALYEFRFSVAMVEGFRVAYGFCDTPGFMLRTGWRAVPVAELVKRCPRVTQVAHFARIGWLPTEHAFPQRPRHQVGGKGIAVRNIVAGLFVSLDGVVQSPEVWTAPYYCDEVGYAIQALIYGGDTFVAGESDLPDVCEVL